MRSSDARTSTSDSISSSATRIFRHQLGSSIVPGTFWKRSSSQRSSRFTSISVASLRASASSDARSAPRASSGSATSTVRASSSCMARRSSPRCRRASSRRSSGTLPMREKSSTSAPDQKAAKGAMSCVFTLATTSRGTCANVRDRSSCTAA